MSPDLMESLQILKFALRKQRLNFTVGTSKDDEIRVLEEADACLEEVATFMRELPRV